jgi:hypothetical protein
MKFKLLSIFFIFFIQGCVNSPDISDNVNNNLKAYPKEDADIIKALEAISQSKFLEAEKYFTILHKKSDKKEYFYESLFCLLDAKKPKVVISRIKNLENKQSFNKDQLFNIELRSYVLLKKYNKALEMALSLLKEKKTEKNYTLVAQLYSDQNHYKAALRYYESAYNLNFSEKVLDKMTNIMYLYLDRKKDAIAYLETHSRLQECSDLICKRLGSYYSKNNNINGMLGVYLRLYNKYKEENIGYAIVKLYTYKKDENKLKKFLIKTGLDDNYLLNIYIDNKEYKKVFPLIKKLYQETGDINYLGQGAIFEYESAKRKNRKVLRSVISKLRKVIKKEPTALYLNYLGYILIDHNIAIKEGIKYVKEAIKIKGNSTYFLDSLAWGYYKLGWCKSAYKVMFKIRKSIQKKDTEMMQHWRKIKRCRKKR